MILKSFVLIKKGERFLLIKEAARKWNGKWFIPGGKVEVNESPELAAARESMEEAGCDIKLNGIFYMKYNQQLFDNYLAIYYAASIVGDAIKTFADKHSLDVRWFTLSEIRQLPVRQNLVQIIEKYTEQNIIPIQNFKIE